MPPTLVARADDVIEWPACPKWGTFRKWPIWRVMSFVGGRSEVACRGSQDRFWPNCMVRPCGARDFVDLVDAVLHYCIRPLIGASAPGHHGYQRASDL